MKKSWKYIGMIVLLLVLGIAKNSQVVLAEEASGQMTMTDLYTNKDYDTVRESHKTITVSSLEEFVMFQKAAVEDTKELEGLSFVQTEDIIASECTFSYDKEDNLIVVWKDGEELGYVNENFKVFDKEKKDSSWEKLGLAGAVSSDKGDSPVFIKGNFDGQNHVLKGFVIGNDGIKISAYGGLFANLSGDLKNLQVKDCCVLDSYGPIANVLHGQMINVSVMNCVGFGNDMSGMIGWGRSKSVISGCTVKDCTIIKEGWSSSQIRFGGVASQGHGLTVKNCKVLNTHIYSKKGIDVAAGGIVGVMDEEGVTISNCVADCNIENFSKAGGIIGEVSGAGKCKITNCISQGTISGYTGTNGVNGGIIGKILNDTTAEIMNSLSTMKLETGGSSGGLATDVSNGESVVQIKNSLFAGQISAKTTGALVAGGSATLQQCYAIRSAGSLFDEDFSKDALYQDCYTISKGQLCGTETSKVIAENGNYKGYCSVLDMLNLFVRGSDDENIKGWTTLKNGMPVPELEESALNYLEDTMQVPEDDTPVPDTSPSSAPSEAPSSAPSEAPSSAPSAAPSSAPSSMPTAAPSDTPSNVPSNTPSVLPTAAPSSAPTTEPNNGKNDNPDNGTSGKDQKQNTSSDQSANHTSNANTTANDPQSNSKSRSSSVKKAKAEALSNKAVKLTWDKKSDYSKIILYYSTDGKKYRKITACSKKKNAYIWRSGKPGKKYYFRFVAYQLQNGKLTKGQTVTKKLLLPSLKTPTYRLSIGKMDDQKYMQITMKKYQGKYVEIALKKGNAAFKQAPMVSHKIAYYNGKIIFTYRKGGVMYSCKLRTYLIKNGKKKYSAYSKVQKIRI